MGEYRDFVVAGALVGGFLLVIALALAFHMHLRDSAPPHPVCYIYVEREDIHWIEE